MALPFQRQKDPTGALSIVLGQLSNKVSGAADNALLVELTGVLDRGTRKWADRALKAVVADIGILYLVLDVRGIEWMSEGSFGVILAILKAMKTRGGALVLLPSPAVREMVQTFGWADYIWLASAPANAALILKSVAGEVVGGEERRRLRFEARLVPVPCLVVRLEGDLDRGYAEHWFKAQVTERIEAGFTKLAIDLSGCKWMCVDGIGCLTTFLKLLIPIDGRLVLFGLKPKILEVFQLLGFVQFFEFADTEGEALAALQRKREEPKAPRFPLIIKCPKCSGLTRVAKPMRGRCRRCGTVLRAAPDGTVSLG
jgi:anti-anti-sigma factor